MLSSAIIGCLFATTALAAAGPTDPGAESVPADTAILELSAPAGSTVIINGDDYGQRRRFSFPGMEPGALYRYEVQVKVPDGPELKRNLLLRGGWRVPVRIDPKPPVRPEVMPQTGHAVSLWAAALSPDGKLALTGGMDNVAVVWDATTGRQLRVLKGHTNHVKAVAFSPDGTRAVTGSSDGSAILWDFRKGEVLRKFTNNSVAIWAVAFSPDGRRLLIDEVLWDVDSGAKIRTFVSPEKRWSRASALSCDGRMVATCTITPDPKITLWNAETGQELRTMQGHAGDINVVAFSPDGKQVASASWDHKVIVWDVETGSAVHTLGGHNDQVTSVCYSPDGRFLLSGGMDEKAILWESASGKPLHTYQRRGPLPGQEDVRAVAFSSDGERAIVGVGFNRAVILDVERWQEQVVLQGATSVVGAAAFNDDGSQARVIVGSSGFTWDAGTGRPVGSEIAPKDFPSSPLTSLAFDPNARYALASTEDKSHHLYDPHSGRKLRVFPNQDGPVARFAATPDGRKILAIAIGSQLSQGTVAGQGKVYLGDIATGEQHELSGHIMQPMVAAVSPDGRYGATGGADGLVLIWDLNTRKKLQTLPAVFGVVALAFSHDGKQLLVGTILDDSAGVWDLASGQRLHTLGGGHTGFVWSLAFSRGHRYVVSGGLDNRVNLWEVAGGTLVRRFEGHSGAINSVQLSPDDRYLLSASFDGTARLWDVATGEAIASLIGLYPGNEWLVITPEGLFDGSRAGRELVSFRFGNQLNVVPVDRFFQDFYRPGLLIDLWRGVRPAPEIELGGTQPPTIRVVSPAGGPVETNRVIVSTEVVDQGGGVRGPWLLHNGVRVLVPGDSRREGQTVRRQFEVPLVAGENRLQVCAANADGSWESEPAVVVLRNELSQARPELHMVTVSVGDYAEPALDLPFPGRDAEAMADLFRDRGADLYAGLHRTSLSDKEATKGMILAKIRAAARETRPQDTLMVFFSGQGAMVGRQYCFLPYELRAAADTRPEEIQQQGILAAEVGEAMAAASALKRVLVFDTSASSGAGPTRRTSRNPFSLRGAVERLARTQGAFTLAATPASDRGQQVTELQHGLLTYTLLAGMDGVQGGPLMHRPLRPSSQDNVAGVLEWFAYASSRLPSLAEKYSAPAFDLQFATTGSDFPMLPVPRSDTPSQQAEVPRTARLKEIAPQKPVEMQTTETSAAAASAHVIAVGVNRYREKSLELRYSVSDATAIGELFRSRGAALYGKVHVQLVLDEQATRQGIRQALSRAGAAAQRDDLVVLFLAGHGAMVGQRYYFLPQDFQARAGQFQEDLRQQGIPADELADALAEGRAGKQMLILDTCASGSVLELDRTLRNPMAFRSFMERMGQREGVFTIAAAAAGEEADEVSELEHGVLTYCLLAGMQAVPAGPLEGVAIQPTNPRGLVDVLDWFSYASGQVPRVTAHYLGKEQSVQTSGHGRSFLVLPIRTAD